LNFEFVSYFVLRISDFNRILVVAIFYSVAALP
jgi:hypothetical protein